MQHLTKISHVTPAAAHFIHVIGRPNYDNTGGGAMAGKMAIMMAPFLLGEDKESNA